MSQRDDQTPVAATARDLHPLDWYIEVCAVCGCQLGPGIGSRTRTGRCVVEEHRSAGGIVVRVQAKPISQQERDPYGTLRKLGVPDA